MNPTTGATQSREIVFLRLDQSFTQFVLDTVSWPPLWLSIPLVVLAAFAAAAVGGRLGYRLMARRRTPGAARAESGGVGNFLWWAARGTLALLVLWMLVVLFYNDTFPRQTGDEVSSAERPVNTALWLTFTGVVFALGTAFAVAMYAKDSRSIRWYWAVKLAALRITVYAVLCFVFLLPALQTYERVEKRSRVVVVLDVSPSVTEVSDEIGTTAPGRKLKSRLATVIEFLSDDKVAFVKHLLAKNPVVVYRFGTRLDEEPGVIGRDDPAWSAADWEAFARYDFKPFLLRGLSDEGKQAVRVSGPWGGDAPGAPDWAAVWLGRAEDEVVPQNMSPEDKAQLKDNRAKLEKRVEVARTIAQGTNVPDSVTAVVNREAANMVQGVIVFSDGRSNIGSDSAYAELKQRAAHNKIPVFTVAVGEDRQTVSVVITDVQAPDNAPPDEAFKIIVEADGVNLANAETEVFLDLFLPNRDPKNDPPDHTLTGKLTFLPGDPPHGQAEFVIDPEKMPDKLTKEAEDSPAKKKVLREGPWTARARIPKHKGEAFAEPEHVRDRPGIQVMKKPLRILLMASGPSREYQALKTMLVRETQESRAELCILLQNKAGEEGTAVQDVPPERLLGRFPTRLDVGGGKDADPKERFYNLNEYDLIIAFDPDWSELSQQQAEDLQRWVQEQGGGLIYVAGPLHTFQLARVEPNSRLSPLLNILPVLPEDIIVVRTRGIPRTPRRLYLSPLAGSDLLKLDEAAEDPASGWEKFFTDREKYAASPDLKVELFPRRGFYTTYPVKDVKPDAKVLANLGDVDERGDKALRPWLVTNNPSAGWRTVFLGSGETYRLFAYDPPTGKGYFERFWVKLMKYTAAKRNVKAARGRILLSKEYIAGSPVRVQARVLDPGSKPYPLGAMDPKFRIVRFSADGQPEKQIGVFEMKARPGATGFDGYYQGQMTPDPKEMPAGDKRYRVIIDVPDSAGETLEGEFMLRKSDPEMDNTRPNYDALRDMAGEMDPDFTARFKNKKQEVRERLARDLPKVGGVTKLAFKLTDRELVALIPECLDTDEKNETNRGKAEDLWDKGIPIPAEWTRGAFNYPQQVSYVLLVVVGLLCWEWTTRKLLRLA